MATKAHVSRAWLYNTAELRGDIIRLRERSPTRPTRNEPGPVRQQASDASLLRRLEVAHDRIRHLTTENTSLRQQLERSLGQSRVQRQSIDTEGGG